MMEALQTLLRQTQEKAEKRQDEKAEEAERRQKEERIQEREDCLLYTSRCV